jgi:hypothetical protein
MPNDPRIHNDPTWFCRVCGLYQGEPAWGADGDLPSFDFCACCGVTFGYGDTDPDNCRDIRAYWVNKQKLKWDLPKLKPADWSWEEQKKQIPPDFQDLENES